MGIRVPAESGCIARPRPPSRLEIAARSDPTTCTGQGVNRRFKEWPAVKPCPAACRHRPRLLPGALVAAAAAARTDRATVALCRRQPPPTVSNLLQPISGPKKLCR